MPKATRQAIIATQYALQYAAKFICTSNIPGTSQTTDSFLPGKYQTVVNVHNPGRRGTRFRVKIALGGQKFISRWLDVRLGPDEVTRFVCRDIREKFKLPLIHGAEGFLVIESLTSLDVVAVYTAGPLRGDVASIDVERVPERKIALG